MSGRALSREPLFTCQRIFSRHSRHKRNQALGTLAHAQKTRKEALYWLDVTMPAMARALVSRPRFILLNKPSAGLSPALVSEALDRARALAERGIGSLMVEQNVREALPMADHLYIMAAGEMKFEGTPRDLTSDQEIMNMYMGHQGIPASTTS